jgi:hypothetical protein
MALDQVVLNPQEVALLAFLAWEREGCPPGNEDRIWREVEAQLAATRALLVQELQLPLPRRGRSQPARLHQPRRLRNGVSTVST